MQRGGAVALEARPRRLAIMTGDHHRGSAERADPAEPRSYADAGNNKGFDPARSGPHGIDGF